MQIKDKIIVITGASEGIGLAIAKKLGAEGAKIILAARSKDKLEEAQKDINESVVVQTDMRSTPDIENLIDTTMSKYGRIDVLINCAGQAVYGKVESVNIEEFKSIMELNVFSVLKAMQITIPIMRKQAGGLILNISSMVSKNYFQNLGAYAATKYALNAVSLTARAELAGEGIIVSVFHPRMTATNFGKNALGNHPDFSSRNTNAAQMPIDTPEDVAEKVYQQITSETAEEMMS
jgi:short-subunit dehydrogenase